MWTSRTLSIIGSFLIIFCSSFAAPAPAQDEGLDIIEQTRIETDPESGQIRFYIDNELVAVLRSDGFHVRENIGNGGTITSYGQRGFDAVMGNTDEVPHNGKDEADAE